MSCDCSFCLADRTLKEFYWRNLEKHKAVTKFSHHFCSKCVVKSGPAQILLILWIRRGHRDKCIVTN